MPTTTTPKFSCPSCSKKYTWKAQLAGKQAKCACGQLLTVPSEAPVEPEEELYDIDQPIPIAPPPQTMAPVHKAPAASTIADLEARIGHRARPAPPPEKNRASKHTASSPTKKIVISLALVGVLIASTVFAVMFMPRQWTQPRKPLLADDAYVEDELKDGVSGEIKEWMAKSNRRMIMGLTNNQAEGLADRFYRMGAKKVVAFGMFSVSIGVELPDDPAKRKEFFQYEHENHNNWQKPMAKDVGQKWILMYMHP